MSRFLPVMAFILLLGTTARGQESPVEIPSVEQKAHSVGGFLEIRPAAVWFETDAALFRLRALSGATGDTRAMQLGARVQFDAGYRRGWFSAQTRTVGDTTYAGGDWAGDATAYEAYASVKPAPSLTVDVGKKTLKWGKGYIWNPAAFLDRAKSPEDPALALEGFIVASADYIRTFAGPLQVMSVTPVLVPAFGNVNNGFGERDHLNVAGKLYMLLYDTDIDVMFLSGGSRPSRFGFDFSRNLRSNLELHGEWSRVPEGRTPVLESDGTLVEREGSTASSVLGARYLANTNTTFTIDYFHNGSGYRPAEMETYFDAIDLAYASLPATGDAGVFTVVNRATEAGYGRLNPMRNYMYGRVNQPDALGVLYLALGASAIVNLEDGSYSFIPDVQYRPIENLELRGIASIQRGGRRTEFGERPAAVRVELRARYYF
jgi:hypothetical protein